jgi:hypothetical protein
VPERRIFALFLLPFRGNAVGNLDVLPERQGWRGAKERLLPLPGYTSASPH